MSGYGFIVAYGVFTRSSKRPANFLQMYAGRLLPSYYNGRSAPFSAFPVARSRTPTATFESLGLGCVPPTLPPTCPHGQLKGAGLSCRVFFPR